MRTGMFFVAGAILLESITGILTIMLNMFMADILPEPAATNSYADTLAAMGFDSITLLTIMVISAIVGFFAALVGLWITHGIGTALGGKAKLGEYFYMGGQFMFAVALVYFVLEVFSVIPCMGCIAGIGSIIFLFYSLYLFILLVSTLYSIDKLRSFIAIAVGYIITAIVSFGVLTALGAVTGFPLGLEMVEQMMSYWENMDYTSYVVPQ